MKPILDRRRFLTALGLGTAGVFGSATLPFWLRGATAAGSDGAPKRLLILSSSHGTVWQHWTMNPWSHAEGTTWQEDITSVDEGSWSRALAPLHRHRDRLVAIDGLSMASAELDLPGYRHEKGWIHAWTGGYGHFTGSDLFSTEPSLDQLVARQIGRADRLASLELSVADGRPVCHAGLAQQLPLAEDPMAVFDRMFGVSGGAAEAQGSVLDYVLAEYDALAPQLSAWDRSRMAQHFDLVRALEQRLTGLAQLSCEGTAPGESFDTYDARFRAMGELIASGFACDVTRVATISLGDLPSQDFGWGEYLSGDAHNDFAHRIYLDEQAALAMADYTRTHSEQVAWLVDLLASTPDCDGNSVMDNTLIVWGGELGDGWHGYERYCALTIGGSWAWGGGRYLKYPFGSSPIDVVVPTGYAKAGLPHQHLLVSVANAMGLDQDYVGIAEAETREGVRVDLRGGLPGLF